MDEDSEEIKTILVGMSGTGKTNIINAMINLPFDSNSITTSTSSFMDKYIEIDKNKYHIELWDTAGQEKYKSLTKIFIKDSKIVIFVYDITRKESFKELDYWFKTIKDVLGDVPVLGIAGNKSDLFMKEQVKEEDAEKYAENKNVSFKLTSAKNPLSFNNFLEDLLKQYITKCGGVIESTEGKKLEDNKKSNDKKKRCC